MSRYRHRQIKKRLEFKPNTVQVEDDLGTVLDEVNAWGYLEQCSERSLKSINIFGPGIFRGYVPVIWAGVCLWYKPRGYHHYSILHLLGIWAVRTGEGDCIDLRLGVRDLPYTLPFFNPEAYFFRIQREFKTFYGDSGTPPEAAHCQYRITYDAAQRLTIRQALQAALADWAESLA